MAKRVAEILCDNKNYGKLIYAFLLQNGKAKDAGKNKFYYFVIGSNFEK